MAQSIEPLLEMVRADEERGAQLRARDADASLDLLSLLDELLLGLEAELSVERDRAVEVGDGDAGVVNAG